MNDYGVIPWSSNRYCILGESNDFLWTDGKEHKNTNEGERTWATKEEAEAFLENCKHVWHVNKPYLNEEKWNIKDGNKSYGNNYLWQGGKVRDLWDSTRVGEQGCFGSEKEAQAFLKSWLIKENIRKLEKELKDLEQQQREQQENLKNPGIDGWELIPEKWDSIRAFLRSNRSVHFYAVSVIAYRSHILIKVPLPVANTVWTFKAFDYVKKLVEEISDLHTYPVHDSHVPDAKALYVRIGS